MRSGITRVLGVVLVTAFAASSAASTASAHGGATLAEGGANGVRIQLQATDSTTPGGKPAVDLSTVVQGPGTDKTVVTYWIRPAGGKTFRVSTTRDAAGISHTDVATEGRGSWRDWDVSAVVRLDDGTRLRVSNAEANPPGPDPASTPGGGAKGPDADSDEGTQASPSTDAEDAPSATTAPDAAAEDQETETETAPVAPAETATDDDDAAPVSDVTGESDGTPGWVVPSIIVVVAAALGWALLRRRGRTGDDDHGPGTPAP